MLFRSRVALILTKELDGDGTISISMTGFGFVVLSSLASKRGGKWATKIRLVRRAVNVFLYMTGKRGGWIQSDQRVYLADCFFSTFFRALASALLSRMRGFSMKWS